MFADMAQEAGIIPPNFKKATAEDQSILDEKGKIECPECGHEFVK
jgi:hypothetical protein